MFLVEVQKQMCPLEDCNFHLNSVPFTHLCYLPGLLHRVMTSWGHFTFHKTLQCSQIIKKECAKNLILKKV